jgi:hypothetical protein
VTGLFPTFSNVNSIVGPPGLYGCRSTTETTLIESAGVGASVGVVVGAGDEVAVGVVVETGGGVAVGGGKGVFDGAVVF